MFRRSLALSTALLGAASAADPPGCHPAYASGKYYAAGDVVSAKGELTIAEDCDPEEVGCPQSGKKAVTKTMNFNYECETEEWCTNSGYAPGDIYSDLAWKMDGAPCEGTAAIEPAIAPLPFLGGCPAEFSDSGEYGSGDRVSVCKTGIEWCSIYVCKADTPSLWCSMYGYEPGASLYWDQAWDKVEGSCSRTIAPTPAVTIDAANVVGGCPSAYDSGTKYKAGDRVSKDNVIFECKPWPFDGWCGLVGYEPMPDVAMATPDAWNEAWNVIGYCYGTIAPTSAPNFVSLKKLGGCPAEWELGTNGFGYDEGDRVAKDGLVFECKRWPFSAHCGQAGYEPLSTEWNDAWKDAWTIAGYCEGTLSPTSVGGLLLEGKNLGECPLREHKIGDEYDGGELVKVCEQADAECCAVYKCAADLPNPSGWCGLNEAYSPGEGFAWKDAWSFEGFCCGHVQPTLEPSISSQLTSMPSESPSASTVPSSPPSSQPSNQPSEVPSKAPEARIILGNYDQPNYLLSDNGIEVTSQITLPGGAWRTLSMAVADVNGDGDNDIIIGNAYQPNQLLLNNGNGGFVPSDLPGGASSTFSVAVADVDGNGNNDIIIGNYGEPNHLLLNNGNGSFVPSDLPGGISSTHSVAVADMDGDGDNDIVVANVWEPSQILLNDGNGSFVPSDLLGGASWTHSVAVADIDGDGNNDVIIGNYGPPNQLLLNNGNGSLVPSDLPGGASDTFSVAVADVDGDGDNDIIIGNDGQPNQLLVNNGNGSFGGHSDLPGGISWNQKSVAVFDFNGDSALDILVAIAWEPSQILLNDGNGGFVDVINLGTGPTFAVAILQ